jgi:dTDP-4-amino-4,6-dideoxygalactose transaminase
MTASRIVPFGRPWITDADRQAVMEVLQGHILTHGPQCKAFEADFAAFLGAEAHCVSVSSCMAALHLSYLHFGLGPGDEVIVPTQTHTATVHAVELVGARPVFVDCDPATGNLTAADIRAALTPRTKAISVVHFLGIPCAMPEIMAMAAERDLRVIEDCALALGARLAGKHVGLFGDVGCFSFYPVKHITTGEGGMFVTRHPEVAPKVARLRAFGVDRTHTERAVPGYYDVPTLGLNYRMSEMQAALGRSQLSRFGENLRRRQANFEKLRLAIKRLPHVRVIESQDPEMQSGYYCLTLVLEGPLRSKRQEIIEYLNKAGVGTSIYYPQPVSSMTYYRNKYGCPASSFPHAAELSDYSLALPVGPHVGEEDIAYLTKIVPQALDEASK